MKRTTTTRMAVGIVAGDILKKATEAAIHAAAALRVAHCRGHCRHRRIPAQLKIRLALPDFVSG